MSKVRSRSTESGRDGLARRGWGVTLRRDITDESNEFP
jgi:hypothetical protein